MKFKKNRTIIFIGAGGGGGSVGGKKKVHKLKIPDHRTNAFIKNKKYES